eukprot:TRINITY_DN8259_c0_g1_i1.p1 TRINITY_DN8259_c0_g1~~TRINITY_DN8259_c0_g1_i1.p1  ORF type:complete len:1336 (+),score=384.79 TRINITY_DN8259_c0_g1_i1:376-4008(+)
MAEQPVAKEEFGTDEPINVGWGKKETQFQGKAGKLAQQPKIPDAQVPVEDGLPRLAWRGDGEYLVSSTCHRDTNDKIKRVLRVWQRDGTLSATSEHVSGLESSLAWRPSGNILASTQRLPHRHDVVFFERNGLRHGEFTLPFKQDQVHVLHMAWNADSSILAVHSVELIQGQLPAAEDAIHHLQLYTMGNYHWYLKQQRVFTGGLDVFVWHPEDSFRYYAVHASSGRVETVELMAQVLRPKYACKQDEGHVGVVDGASVLYTPLRRVVVPPPMCHYTLTVPKPVTSVTFAPVADNAEALSAVAMLCDGTAIVHSLDGTQAAVQGMLDVQAAVDVDKRKLLRHATLLTGTQLVFVTCDDFEGDIVHVAQFSMVDGNVHIEQTASLSVAKPIVALTSIADSSTEMVLETADGEVHTLSMTFDNDALQLNLQPLNHGQGLTLPEVCYQIYALRNTTDDNAAASYHILALSPKHRLYVDEHEIANNVTSLSVRLPFALVTTTTHKLHLLDVATDLTQYKLTDEKVHEYDCSLRAVERGAELVATPNSDIKVILQMPRGNLEAVTPSGLVLHEARRLLAESEFRKAFLLLRRHRVSLNLLLDYHGDEAMEKLPAILKALGSVDFINLLIMELKNEDVTLSMYPLLRNARQVPSAAAYTRPNKVNTMCAAIRKALLALDSDAYLHSILTTYVKHEPAQLEDALRHVLAVRTGDGDADKDDSEDGRKQRAERARAALKYMLLLVDVKKLYNAALASYNLEFVLLVAQVAQMDPKEYVPFLQKLDSLPEPLKQFEIEHHLKRYARALLRLLEAGTEQHDRFYDICVQQQLYPAALAHITQAKKDRPNEQEELHVLYKRVAGEFGTALLKDGRPQEAALMLTKAEKYPAAADAFIAAGDWQRLVPLLRHFSAEDQADLSDKMVESLDGLKHPMAAGLFLELRGQPADALEYYASAQAWSDAVRLARCHDLVDDSIRTALMTVLNGLQQQIQGMAENMQNYAERLYHVRAEKIQRAKEDALGLHDDDDEFDFARDSDLFSEASSVRSRNSRSSRRSRSSRKSSTKSAKGRRRHEAKKYSLKQGGVFEEEALMHELSRLALILEGLQQELTPAILAAAELDLGPLAAQVQEEYKRARKSCVYNVSRAWKPLAMRSTWLLDMGIATGSVAGSEIDFLTLASEQLEIARQGGQRKYNPAEDVELAERPIKPKVTDQVALSKCV